MRTRTGSRTIGRASAAVLLVSLTACGGSEADNGGDADAGDPGTTVSENSGIDPEADDLGEDAAQAGDDAEQDTDEDQPSQPAAGRGMIEIAGTPYDFEAEACFESGSFLQISGPGVSADGVLFYGSIDVNEDEDYDEDGTPDPSGTVTLEFGTDSAFGGADDAMASYEATLLIVGDQIDIREFDYDLDGSGNISGSGTITDYNGVETEFNEYVDLKFSGGC